MGYTVRSTDEWVSVGELQLPSAYALTYSSPVAREPGWEVNFAVEDGIPRCVSVTIQASEGGREVRASDLRALPRLEELAEDVAANVARHRVQRADGAIEWVQDLRRFRDVRADVGAVRRGARRTITDDVLRRVGEVYREHATDRPTAAVRLHFDLNSDRTARQYVQRAREGGFLGAAEIHKGSEH